MVRSDEYEQASERRREVSSSLNEATEEGKEVVSKRTASAVRMTSSFGFDFARTDRGEVARDRRERARKREEEEGESILGRESTLEVSWREGRRDTRRLFSFQYFLVGIHLSSKRSCKRVGSYTTT